MLQDIIKVIIYRHAVVLSSRQVKADLYAPLNFRFGGSAAEIVPFSSAGGRNIL